MNFRNPFKKQPGEDSLNDSVIADLEGKNDILETPVFVQEKVFFIVLDFFHLRQITEEQTKESVYQTCSTVYEIKLFTGERIIIYDLFRESAKPIIARLQFPEQGFQFSGLGKMILYGLIGITSIAFVYVLYLNFATFPTNPTDLLSFTTPNETVPQAPNNEELQQKIENSSSIETKSVTTDDLSEKPLETKIDTKEEEIKALKRQSDIFENQVFQKDLEIQRLSSIISFLESDLEREKTYTKVCPDIPQESQTDIMYKKIGKDVFDSCKNNTDDSRCQSLLLKNYIYGSNSPTE